MVSFSAVTVSRVRNGYIVERPWVPSDPGRQLDETRVFNDFDDLCGYLEMLLGDPSEEQAAQAVADLDRENESSEHEAQGDDVELTFERS